MFHCDNKSKDKRETLVFDTNVSRLSDYPSESSIMCNLPRSVNNISLVYLY